MAENRAKNARVRAIGAQVRTRRISLSPRMAESGETYRGAICLGPRIIAVDSPFLFSALSRGDGASWPLWPNFIVGVDRVIEVFGCEAREAGRRRHSARDGFGKSERA
jgi:hypothetical protein